METNWDELDYLDHLNECDMQEAEYIVNEISNVGMSYNLINNKKEQENEFTRLFPTTSNNILAKKYGVKESTIRMWASKIRILKANNFYWSELDIRFLQFFWKKTTNKLIADKLGRTRWAVINKKRHLSGYQFNRKINNL